MNANQPEKLVPPADRNGARSARDTANPDELKDDLGKYEHLEELAERFFATKRRHSQAPQVPQPLYRCHEGRIGR
jgi:hypothetical protein